MPAGVERRRRIKELLAAAVAGEPVEVTGWVKTSRISKNVSFVHIFDGSCAATVQVVLDADLAEQHKNDLGIGAAVRVAGVWVASVGGEQALEVQASTVTIVGEAHPTEYPLRKQRMTMEHLRTIAHLRPRTNTFQSVFRVRNALAWQVHRFFQERGFLWIHTPIITGSDAEGAGEVFPLANAMDFFGHPAFLTVSGQLEVECFAQSHTDVYTFGPTFRAENSNTPRHAAEFWMIEPEMAFANLDDVIALAESFVRQVIPATHAQCPDDFAFFDERIEPGVLRAVADTVAKPFSRITYRDAQQILAASGRTFEYPIGFGTSLQAEHERFLAEEYFKGPVFVTNYPREQKPFYMRVDDGGETVACTDLLVPRVGELIGGSQREERLSMLDEQLKRTGTHPEPLWWYTDLRRYGTTPHGGFGLGFERLILWATGMKNIRDVLPFARTPGNAAF